MRALTYLALILLAGCASVQQAINGWEAAAGVSLRAAEDNNIILWVANACATPYDAVLRNPRIAPALDVLCGRQPNLNIQPVTSAAPAPTMGVAK